jgi:hypothetical protein
MAALMFGTKYDSFRKFRKATGDSPVSVIRISPETFWVNKGMTPLYLKGRTSDFPQFVAGAKVTYEGNGKVLNATIDQLGEDANGWGDNTGFWMTALILKNPDVDFSAFGSSEGGIVYLTPAATSPSSKKSWVKWLIIAGIIAGGFYLYKKYKK